MLKTYKYRIYPNVNQIKLIEQTFGCCRLVYNLALEVKIRAYKEHGVGLSGYDLIYQLTELKKDFSYLNEVDSQALQASVNKIDISFKNFFRGSGYPKFKSKREQQSFQCPRNTRKIDWINNTLTIPKIKNIPIILDRAFDGQIKTVTISKTNTGKYFASVLVDNKLELPEKVKINPDTAIGIDLGIKDFAILSTGEKIKNPKYLRNGMKRLKVLQRRASRKKKGSCNRKKANKRLAIYHEKIANRRKDFLQKVSTRIIGDNQTGTVCVETLAVANMMKNHHLAQAISDVGWYEFVRMLEYKANWYGKNIIRIGRFEASTKTCSNCGAKNELLTLSDRSWTCGSCFVTHDRDVNAAKNIKFIGLNTGKGIPGEPVELSELAEAKKQEVKNYGSNRNI